MVLAVPLVWVVIAQAQMRKSWRIGIDTKLKPPLVRSGPFSKNRKCRQQGNCSHDRKRPPGP